jgi:hypothetical protein
MKLFLSILGILASMIVSGAVAFFVTILVLMQLGLSLHDNYEYYGRYPLLVWGPASLAFVTPAVIASQVSRRRGRMARGRESKNRSS